MNRETEHEKPRTLTNVAIAVCAAIGVLAVLVLMCGVGGVFLGYRMFDPGGAQSSMVTDVEMVEMPSARQPAAAAPPSGASASGGLADQSTEAGGGAESDRQREAARGTMRAIQQQLEAYRVDVGGYPSEQQGLNALLVRPGDLAKPEVWQGPYTQHIPSDPWGLLYTYQHVAPDGYRLSSHGPDNVAGTQDDLVVERGGTTPLQPAP